MEAEVEYRERLRFRTQVPCSVTATPEPPCPIPALPLLNVAELAELHHRVQQLEMDFQRFQEQTQQQLQFLKEGQSQGAWPLQVASALPHVVPAFGVVMPQTPANFECDMGCTVRAKRRPGKNQRNRARLKQEAAANIVDRSALLVHNSDEAATQVARNSSSDDGYIADKNIRTQQCTEALREGASGLSSESNHSPIPGSYGSDSTLESTANVADMSATPSAPPGLANGPAIVEEFLGDKLLAETHSWLVNTFQAQMNELGTTSAVRGCVAGLPGEISRSDLLRWRPNIMCQEDDLKIRLQAVLHRGAKHGNCCAEQEDGYVCFCSNATEGECLSRMLFASWKKDLPEMKRCIGEHTQLFLQNFESHQIMGPFRAVCNPQLSLCPDAFSGKFTAHVRVKPMLGDFILTTDFPVQSSAGPQTTDAVNDLWKTLRLGHMINTRQKRSDILS